MATVCDLRVHLSAYLHQVEAGETVVITRHGKAVGRIVPVRASLEMRLAALEQAGLIAWNGGRLPPLAPVARTEGPTTLADLVAQA
ncbi:MAG: type II toxin-antitoxin system prevent-host-death family antitoxin [Anaerolineae bacterium]|nr:type II toxin-antitoxin system prevent-host-death family antitoxin [Anaerolineae bacterium]